MDARRVVAAEERGRSRRVGANRASTFAAHPGLSPGLAASLLQALRNQLICLLERPAKLTATKKKLSEHHRSGPTTQPHARNRCAYVAMMRTHLCRAVAPPRRLCFAPRSTAVRRRAFLHSSVCKCPSDVCSVVCWCAHPALSRRHPLSPLRIRVSLDRLL